MAKPKTKLSVVNSSTAGIDIGSRKIFIALPDKPVLSFGTFTDDFIQAVTYLKQNNISSVAMEATGVYWISLYDILDQSGFDVFLVKSSQAKAIPGRKTDVQDCQWIQQLHSYGLLRASFIPPQHIRILRAFVRQRRTNLFLASDHIRRAHKALELMNIKLQNVITQINGKSGLAVLSAIVNGNHDPILLASLCEDSILKKKKDAVIRSLKGNFSQENIFLLKQALDAYLFYMKQVDDCDKQIEKHLASITDHLPEPKKLNKPKPIRHHKPNIDQLHLKLMKLTGGKDPSQITGLTDSTLLQVISEVGTDLSRFPTEKHFTSWLGLAPNSHQSGLTNKKKKFKRHTSAGQIFRLAAQAIAQSKHLALTSFYHRIKSRKGSLTAIKATARKIAVIFYNVMTKGIEFAEQGIKLYEQKIKERQLKYLHKQAKRFGLTLSPQLLK
jgi:transposase